MLCPIRDCEKKGVLSLTKELGLESKTIDSPLLFCRDHFCDMCDTYSTYKGIEDMQGFLCLFSDFWWTRNDFDFLTDLRNSAELALSLRERFQERLKDEIPKDGHQHFMNEMRQSIDELNIYLENRGEKWTFPKQKRRITREGLIFQKPVEGINSELQRGLF